MIDEDHRTLILRVSYLNPNLNIKKKKRKICHWFFRHNKLAIAMHLFIYKPIGCPSYLVYSLLKSYTPF